jgi:hypothetical protein
LLLILAALGGGAGGEGGWCGERDGEEGEDWEGGDEHFEEEGLELGAVGTGVGGEEEVRALSYLIDFLIATSLDIASTICNGDLV